MPQLSKVLASKILDILRLEPGALIAAMNKLVSSKKATFKQFVKVAKDENISLGRALGGLSQKGARPNRVSISTGTKKKRTFGIPRQGPPQPSSAQSQQLGKRQVGSSILKLIKSGKLLTGRQADARTAKALSEVPKPTGTFSKATLFGGAAGGFLLAKVLGGGGDGGDPAKATARQKILEVLMGENKRADRQPLIDAQAELARVKVMALLQRIMSQKVATNAAIPFS